MGCSEEVSVGNTRPLSHVHAYLEDDRIPDIFSDSSVQNTCPGAGQCAMSGHGKPLSVPDGGLSMSTFIKMMGVML